MIQIFCITAFMILVYLAYPLWLNLMARKQTEAENEIDDNQDVTVILLSYNGREYLDSKIRFLLKELSAFQHYELIIIDDKSGDGSAEVLEGYRNTEHVNIIYNSTHSGIPYSMNLGVAAARYDLLVFCDQRQALSENIIHKITEPLKNKNIGAVSGCISAFDKRNSFSFIRKHENFLKSKESLAGNLMGVYGPFYAVKKSCYSPIPENIILDDLYLSLKILKTKQIELKESCVIIDGSLSVLYDYQRTRRYLMGLLQILFHKSLIMDLSYKQRTMLIWHKYLRLIIPLLLFSCFISLGLAAARESTWVYVFLTVTLLALLSVLPPGLMLKFRFKNLIRMNILYILASLDILVNDYLFRRKGNLMDTRF